MIDNKPKDNKVFLVDKKGDTIFKKLPSHLVSNTLYKEGYYKP